MDGSIGVQLPPLRRRADRPAPGRAFIDAYSLEVSAKAVPALAAAAARIAPGTTIAIPCLAGEDDDARLRVARAVRELGFEPMPHICARRIASSAAFDRFVGRAVAEAGVERCLAIAGDLSAPVGPFGPSLDWIETYRSHAGGRSR